jgi:myo-inositol-1(or 4)-monophosphatase
MTNYSKELETAKQAAEEAAQLIRDFQKNRNFEINLKGLNDLVTDADVAVEKKIKAAISDAFSDDYILAEESSKEKVVPAERVWIIDPIDGTTNFAHNFPVYGVSIALWEKMQPKVAVVLEVNSNELFESVAGEGAYCNGKAISVSSIEDSARALIGTGFPYNNMDLLDHYVEFFKWLLHHSRDVRRPGAASFDLCCVAAGRLEGFYEYALKPWDVGAAALIVQEAGGVVTDWNGGVDWLYGERIIVGNPAIHSFLLQAIKEHFLAEELRK